MADELPELIVADADAWRAWLSANHEDPQTLARGETVYPQRRKLPE